MDHFIIYHRGVLLRDATQLAIASRALNEHFKRAGITPMNAATAAFKQEGEDVDVTPEEGASAEVWRASQGVVAQALMFETADIDLELQKA